jgi:iron complex transport system substrate-binding protein
LTTSEEPNVYIEWLKAWRSKGPGTAQDILISNAGGLSIAHSAAVSTPTLGSEFVIESNPDVIVCMYYQSRNLTDYQTTYNEMITRTGMQGVNAVTTGRVYVCYYFLTSGLQYPFGELYFAQWFHPDLFADVDVNALHAEFIQKYFGVSLSGTWVYTGQ